MQLSEIDSVVREFLLADDAGTTKYSPVGEDGELGGVEVLPGLLYRYRQADPRSVNLQVFAGLGELVAQLWDQEVKVLLRVASMRHPALPEVLNGGHLAADKVAALLGYQASGNIAYIRTLSDLAIDAADIGDITTAMRADPVHALRQFWLLADALSILHDARIAHRNLWPGTLQAYQEPGHDDKWSLRLSRFEMSALLSNILRASSVDAAGRDVVRELYLSQERQALRYAPPERLRFLLDAGAGDQDALGGAGLDYGDVFSLGMIVAEWFIGGFPAEHDPCATPSLGGPSPAALTEFHQWVRREVRTSGNVPTSLGALLDDMLDPRPAGRPTTADVLQRLSKNYDGIVSLLQGTAPEQPYLLLYLPETGRNLVEWGWLDEESVTDVCREIEEDLRGAVVVESPEGAEPYVTNWHGDSPEKLRQARWVLVGKRAAWFCRPYELKPRAFRSGELLSNVYVIGYVAVRDRAGAAERFRRLEDVPLQRRVGFVHVDSDQIAPEVLEQRRRGRPDWTSLFDTVVQPVPLSPKEQEFAQALDFLLEYQGAQLQARTYAFRRDPDYLPGSDTVALRWDRDRDRQRKDRLPPLHAKLHGDSGLRPPFAQFFEDVSHGAEESQPQLRMDKDDGRVSAESRVGEFLLAGTRGEDTVVLTGVSRVRIPENGLLSPAGDSGAWTAIRRQTDARHELVRNRILVNRLMKPMGIKSDPGRWAGAPGALAGEGAEVVIDMLCHQLIYALQGPPGTGKTEVSSQAVYAYLRSDPRARVLVSAQSHYALDNLAVRVLGKLGMISDDGVPQDADFLAIRVYNEQAYDRVDPRLRAFQVDDSAVRLKGAIKRRVRDRLESRIDLPRVRQVAESWLAEIDGTEIELGDRLRRGANLVFVTCSSASHQTLVDNGSREPFDWVMIEEAAKAWPTELALPLVRGLRWTLVGDQQQIGAFGLDEVKRFLNSCAGETEPEIAKHYGRKDAYLKTFELFGTMIQEARPGDPVRRLTEQRRMHDPICQVVSRSFYAPARPTRPRGAFPAPRDPLPEGILVTMRPEDGHVIESPHWLPGRSLLWIDTSGVHGDMPHWGNPYEAQLVAALSHAMRPALAPIARHEASRRGLAILTPYRQQAELIRKADPSLDDAIRTVDSFQGREADVVMVSLVRDTVRGSWDRPLKNIGHLADPSRVNVMLSRARDLLVIVGSFDHFAGSGVECWEKVTSAVDRFGVRRTAGTVLSA
jgi:hypothetical protein